MTVLVHRTSGLLEPYEVPELTIGASIERSCELGTGGLLERKQPEYLPVGAHVYPLPGFEVKLRQLWWWNYPHIPYVETPDSFAAFIDVLISGI